MTQLLLIVTIAGNRVAIPAAEVESVVELESVTPVPRSAAHIAGLAALRSRVLTVIDCRASLELSPAADSVAADAMVVEAEGHPYALFVEQVEDVIEATGDAQPVRNSLGRGWERVSKGMVEAGNDILLLIDTQALLAGPPSEGPLAA